MKNLIWMEVLDPVELLRRILVAFAIGAMVLFAPSVARAAKPTKEGLDFFEKNIRPVLAGSCYKCHRATAKEKKKLAANLCLDSWTGIAHGGQSGVPVVIPGDPDKSLLVKAIRFNNTGDDEDRNMPPKSNEGAGGKLPDDTIKKFEAWVEMGAPLSAGDCGRLGGRDGKIALGLPGAKVSRPSQGQRSHSRAEPLDALVISALEKNGLMLNRPADPRTLLRRATLDLTGLPPTPAEVEAFMHDHSPGAFAKWLTACSPRRAMGKGGGGIGWMWPVTPTRRAMFLRKQAPASLRLRLSRLGDPCIQ